MEWEQKERILSKLAYQVRAGQGYGALRGRGFDPEQARAAVQAYYAQRGRKSSMLHPGDMFVRRADGGLAFRRAGSAALIARPDEGNRLYGVSSRRGGGDEALLDRGWRQPMSARRVAQAPMVPAAPTAAPAVVAAPPTPQGGTLPQLTQAQVRAFDTYNRGMRDGGGEAAIGARTGRMAGRMANAGQTDAGAAPSIPAPAALPVTNVAYGPPSVVTTPAPRARSRNFPAIGGMVAGSGMQ